jgi:AcrR family transcriptional regulator
MDAQLNRERILEVAKEAFARSGASTSLDDIAKHAGVGAGTLYRHFPTRDTLLDEMAVFPNGKYDDQVDSTSQALDWVKDGVLVLGVVEYIRSEEAKLGLFSQSPMGDSVPAHNCPECNSIAIVKIGSQQRCSQCGLQWGKVPQVTEPSRR